jgi:hypothetical protein
MRPGAIYHSQGDWHSYDGLHVGVGEQLSKLLEKRGRGEAERVAMWRFCSQDPCACRCTGQSNVIAAETSPDKAPPSQWLLETYIFTHIHCTSLSLSFRVYYMNAFLISMHSMALPWLGLLEAPHCRPHLWRLLRLRMVVAAAPAVRSLIV